MVLECTSARDRQWHLALQTLQQQVGDAVARAMRAEAALAATRDREQSDSGRPDAVASSAVVQSETSDSTAPARSDDGTGSDHHVDDLLDHDEPNDGHIISTLPLGQVRWCCSCSAV
jgi:hypothetical protein